MHSIRRSVTLPSTRWLKEAKALLILMGDAPEARRQFFHSCSRAEQIVIKKVCGEWRTGALIMTPGSFQRDKLGWIKAIAVILSWRAHDDEKALHTLSETQA